jgi:hypothetical protein
LKKQNKNYNPLENNKNVLPNVKPGPKPAVVPKADKTKAKADKSNAGVASKSSTSDKTSDSNKPAGSGDKNNDNTT